MKDFDSWNELKKKTEDRPSLFGAHARELWWVSFGLNVGVEIDGKHTHYERPALIIKRFNSEMLWVLPTTSQDKDNRFYEKFLFNEEIYFAAITQIRTISTKRLLRKIGMVSKPEFNIILQRVIEILKTQIHEDPH